METSKKAGQPMKFATPEEMQVAIDQYFEYCNYEQVQVYNAIDASKEPVLVATEKEPRKKRIPYTIEGLANSLGITRQTLLNYETKPQYARFFDTVKAAKQAVYQQVHERGLMGESPTGAYIFYTCNNIPDYENQFSQKVQVEDITVKLPGRPEE